MVHSPSYHRYAFPTSSPHTASPMGDASLLLAAIVESSEDAIFSKTLDGLVRSWNSGAERLYGYSSHEMIGQPIHLLMPPERRAELADIMHQIRTGNRVEHLETVRRRKDGRLVEVSLTISPVKDASGTIVGASTIARDITHRKQMEEQLHRSERRLRALIEQSTDAIALLDTQGMILYASASTARAGLFSRRTHRAQRL